jgi:peptide/nickel transport system substrate-binding protein
MRDQRHNPPEENEKAAEFIDLRHGLNRRDFLRLTSIFGASLAGSLVLAACGDATATPASSSTTTNTTTAASGATSGTTSSAAPPVATTAAGATGAATTATGVTSGKAPSGTLTIAQGADMDSADPHANSSGTAAAGYDTIFERLVGRDVNYQLIPVLALNWKTVDDNTWELKLRQGVQFHNGEPFDANSVKFSILRYLNPATKAPWASLFKPIKDVEIVDDYTVRVKTSQPFGDLIENLAGFIQMLPPKAAANMSEFIKKPAGTGPYKFVSWTPNDRLVAEAAGPHWSGQPLLKSVVFRVIPDSTTRVTELKAGGVDIITNVPPLMISSLKGQGDLGVVQEDGATGIVLIFNMLNTEAFKNKAVRQAINYAIDKDNLIKVLLQNAATRMTSPFAKGAIGGYIDGLAQYDYDPEKAKALLKEAGYGDGLKFNLKSPNGRFLQDKQVSEALVGQLARVGITAELEALEWSTYVQGVIGHKYDLFMMVTGALAPNSELPNDLSGIIKGSKWQGYSNPQVDDLIDKAAKTLDSKERGGLYDNISKIIWEDCPWVFLYQPQDLYAVNNRVKNFKPALGGVIQLGKTEVA